MNRIVEKALGELSAAVAAMAHEKLNEPCFVDDGEFRRTRFEDPSRAHACILKAACLANNVQASALLVEQGWLHEAGTLFRQLNELNDDLHFLLENELDVPEQKYQARYLDEFFKEMFDDPPDVTNTTPGRYQVPRKNVHSASSRLLEGHGVLDFSSNQSHLTTMHRMYSAYAHASYSTLMDVLYADGRTEMTLGPRKDYLQETIATQFVAILRAGVISVALLAHRLGMEAQFLALRDLDTELAGV